MKQMILKWFDLLNFPRNWRDDVATAAEHFSPAGEQTPMWHLLNALRRCDDLKARYEERGIGEDILLNTLDDIVIWSKNQYLVHKTIGLSDAAWLEGHLNMQLVRLGRLQFKLEHSIAASEKFDLKAGDPVIGVHIPQGEPMHMEDIHKAYLLAQEFLPKYFPEHKYKYFTCGSWLLDHHFKDFLKPTSNILKFASEYEVIHWAPSNDAMRRLFELNPNKGPENTFQKNVRTFVENGGQTLEGYGILIWDGLAR